MNPVLASFFRRCANSPHRRSLAVLLFVLLGHVLLVWLLIQNRWIVVSETTVTFMPPIMASIVLSQASTGKNGKQDGTKAPPRNRLDGDLDLKPSRELSYGALRVQRSVPWLNTELLPELRGNNADPRADRQERVGSADKEPRSKDGKTERSRASASRAERKVTAKSNARRTEPVLSIPPPSDTVQLIPPPPQQQPALVTVPLPAPAVAEARPTAPVPSIPDPAQSGPRDIPSLWSQTPTPPPALVLIPPTPPQLKTIVPTPAPAALPEPPTAAVKPAPEPVRAAPPPPPRVATTVTPPPPPKAVPPVAPPELPPAPPLALTPSITLPSPTQPSPPVATNVIVVPPPAQAPVTQVAPVTSPSAGATAVTAPPSSITEAPVARNPMVVEVPRYRIAEPNPAVSPVNAVSGPGSSGNAANKTDQTGDSGGRSGPDGAGSKSGSVFGLGIASPDSAPPPLPTATAPNSAKAKALNLSLPRVEVYRGPPMGRQLSVSEMANAQLRRGEAKDAVAEAMNSAENPDCVKPDKDGSGGGLLAAPMMAYKAMTGKCK